jgi:anti-sigma-K factor RskA
MSPDMAEASGSTQALEYVLGLMDGDERRRFEVALIDDPRLAAMVWQWEEALLPLAEAPRPRPAPRRVRHVVERRLFGDARKARRAALRAAGFWRRTAALMGLAAVLSLAALLVVLLRPEAVPPEVMAPEPQWMAAIEREDARPALARLRQDGTLVAGPFPAEGEGAPHLWLVPPDGAPVGLGPLDRAGVTTHPLPGEAADLLRPGARLQVTLEPASGEPPPTPSGPTVGSGILTRI